MELVDTHRIDRLRHALMKCGCVSIASINSCGALNARVKAGVNREFQHLLVDVALESRRPVQELGLVWIDAIVSSLNHLQCGDMWASAELNKGIVFFYCYFGHSEFRKWGIVDHARCAINSLFTRLHTLNTETQVAFPGKSKVVFEMLEMLSVNEVGAVHHIPRLIDELLAKEVNIEYLIFMIFLAVEFHNQRSMVREINRTRNEHVLATLSFWNQLCDRDRIARLLVQVDYHNASQSETDLISDGMQQLGI